MTTTKTVAEKIDDVLENGSIPPWERTGEDATNSPDVLPPSQMETGIIVPEAQAGELVVPDDTAAAPGQMAYSEEMEFELGDLKIPYLRLASAMTPEVGEGKAKQGQWLLEGHDPVDEVEIVITAGTRFRELREKTDNGQPGPTLCRSGDGKVGVGAPGGLCKTCPLSQWGPKKADGRGTPPPCNEGFSYQVYSLTHQQPAILSLRRSGIDAAKVINTMIQLRKTKNFVAILNHEDRPNPANPKGKYPAPHARGRIISQEERAEVEASLIPAAI